MRWLDRFDRALQQIEELARTAPPQDAVWVEKQASRMRAYRALLGAREVRVTKRVFEAKEQPVRLARCGCCYERDERASTKAR